MGRSKDTSARVRMPGLLTFVLVVAVLYLAREVLVPVAVAVLLTFLLAPSVRLLERARLPRMLAVLVVAGAAGLSLGGLGWVLERQIVDLVSRLPEYKSNIAAKFDNLRPSSHGVLGEAQNIMAELGHELAKPAAGASANKGAQEAKTPTAPVPVPVRIVDLPTAPLTYVAAMLRPLLAPLATTGIVVIFTIFMLFKREDLRNRFIRLIGTRDLHHTTQVLDVSAQRVSRFMLMQCIVNGATGLAIGIGLLFLGVPNAWLWGLFAALMRFVPYVGIWIAAAMPLLVSLAVSPGWTQPALTLGLFVAVEVVCGNFVEPLLYGSGTGVSPLALLAAAVFWTWVWGGVGLLLSTPITVCLVVLGRHVPQMRFLSVLLGDEPPLTPEAQFYQRLLAEDPEEAAQIVEAFAKDKRAVEVYDTLILPALRMAETDRHAGELDEEREQSVADSLDQIIADIGERPEAGPTSDQAAKFGRVLCLPARDRADELAAVALAQVLRASGVEAETLSAQSLSGELLSAVAEHNPSVVCISAVPPGAAVHVRVLAKRLRARFRELPIVVGVWAAGADIQLVRQRVGTVATDLIATNLAQAVELIRPLALQPPDTDAPATDGAAAPRVVVNGALVAPR